ncbi:patatin-like phospholipase family protein [Alteromonas oceanisediminis]|uniref:patatin-like phospholipase family protein n=1 Tax=Alteromonas oceanisediminis TaxID=2836180 RepID=UPI001BDA6F12|nr:patatin-like phospholipase family protein [Alteromonas oceanisediminis]MBT0585405.1 patatin-like phospholipase family protein [Alteromonas oceanisediminis]
MGKLILSLDGGGIRGAATTQFLCHVENELFARKNITLRDCVDFYAGTSTGSIIALALATTRLSMEDINALYSESNAQSIFKRNRGWLEFDGINAPKYQAAGKSDVLQRNFENACLNDVATGKHVLAVTYGVEYRRPFVLKSTKAEHRTLRSADVADASSAAPTYFPTKAMRIGDNEFENWLIDGGVIANNPTLCAIAEARRVWASESFSELRVLSVGTGYRTRKINGPDSAEWGALQWMSKGSIIDILSDEMVVAYQAITLIENGNYIRVNAQLKEQPGLPTAPDDAMDDISATNIRKLRLLGDFWFEQYGEQVIQLLLEQYDGPSLDRIDAKTGKPITYEVS